MLNVPERKKIRRLQNKSDLISEWNRLDPVLLDGEFGVEHETGLFKIGNGISKWSELDYGGAGVDVNTLVSTEPTNKLVVLDGKLYVHDDSDVNYVDIYLTAKS